MELWSPDGGGNGMCLVFSSIITHFSAFDNLQMANIPKFPNPDVA